MKLLFFVVIVFLSRATAKVVMMSSNNVAVGAVSMEVLQKELFSLEDNLRRQLIVDKSMTVFEGINGYSQFAKRLRSINKLSVDELDLILNNYINWKHVSPKLKAVIKIYDEFTNITNPVHSNLIANISNSLHYATNKLHEVIKHDTLIHEIANFLKNVTCVDLESPRQVLISVYKTVALTELGAYIGLNTLHLIKKTEIIWAQQALKLRNDYKKRMSKMIADLKSVSSATSNDIWRCDPIDHISNTTYVEITQLVQGYIQNEVNLESNGRCWDSCSQFVGQVQTKMGHSCENDDNCARNRGCNGMTYNCGFVDSQMWVCPSLSTSSRRYEYVDFGNGMRWGVKQRNGCNTKAGRNLNSWKQFVFWECSYCMCLCDEPGARSDRYISLRRVRSDVRNNYVVTGLRFVKKNRIIQFQVEQGKLLPYGVIDKRTVHWKPIEDFKITTRHIQNNQDYVTLSYLERSVDLDDLTAGENRLITGVRFWKLGTHLNLQIYVTPFNFSNGLLKPERSVWIEHNLTIERKKIIMEDKDTPLRSNGQSKIISKHGQYVEFTHTSFKKDVAQTTVPFFDGQMVSSHVSKPLHGVGLYLKAAPTSGGFIGIRIRPLDTTASIN